MRSGTLLLTRAGLCVLYKARRNEKYPPRIRNRCRNGPASISGAPQSRAAAALFAVSGFCFRLRDGETRLLRLSAGVLLSPTGRLSVRKVSSSLIPPFNPDVCSFCWLLGAGAEAVNWRSSSDPKTDPTPCSPRKTCPQELSGGEKSRRADVEP